MKILASFCIQFLVLIQISFGDTKIEIVTVTWPVFHPDYDGDVVFAKSPRVGRDVSNPFYHSKQYTQPYFVGGVRSGSSRGQDVNLISAFRLRVHASPTGENVTFIISTAIAGKPTNHPLSLEKVVEYTKKAIRADFPDKVRFPIKVPSETFNEQIEGYRNNTNAETVGADQPATAQRPKLDGEKKLKPESETGP